MRRASWSIAPLVLLAALGARPAAAGWEEGKKAYDEGRYADAEKEFRAGAEASPDVAQWHFMLGASLLHLERAPEAVPSLKRAVELAGDQPQYRLLLAQSQLAAGAPDEALTSLEPISIAALDERGRAGYAQLLAVAAAKGTHPEAVRRQLEAAAPAVADSAPLWFALGQARRTAGDLPASFDAFSRSFELAPADADKGRAAIQVAFEAAEKAADDAGRQEWYARAGGVADRVAALDEGGESRVTAGEAWLSAKRYPQARAAFEKAAAAAPNDARIAYDLGRCDLGEEKAKEALGRFDSALRRTDDAQLRRSIQSQRGVALHRLGDYAAAAAAFRAAGDEESARTAEQAAAAAEQNRQFAQHQQECRDRVGKLTTARDELARIGAKRDADEVDRKLTAARRECAPYLSEPGG
jgi:tetratricopeptide (TPR) repeat protein